MTVQSFVYENAQAVSEVCARNPPTDSQSNYRLTEENLIDAVHFPSAHVQRIQGEVPLREAERSVPLLIDDHRNLVGAVTRKNFVQWRVTLLRIRSMSCCISPTIPKKYPAQATTYDGRGASGYHDKAASRLID
jgi:hypothetical protein